MPLIEAAVIGGVGRQAGRQRQAAGGQRGAAPATCGRRRGENLKFTLFSELSTRDARGVGDGGGGGGTLLLPLRTGLDDEVYPSLYFQSQVSFHAQ